MYLGCNGGVGSSIESRSQEPLGGEKMRPCLVEFRREHFPRQRKQGAPLGNGCSVQSFASRTGSALPGFSEGKLRVPPRGHDTLSEAPYVWEIANTFLTLEGGQTNKL